MDAPVDPVELPEVAPYVEELLPALVPEPVDVPVVVLLEEPSEYVDVPVVPVVPDDPVVPE